MSTFAVRFSALGEEGLRVLPRLGVGLVHLPVAAASGLAQRSSRTSTPGSFLPSSGSRAAPPPVDRWVTVRPARRASAAPESPPPTTSCLIGGRVSRRRAWQPRTAPARSPMGPFQSAVPAGDLPARLPPPCAGRRPAHPAVGERVRCRDARLRLRGEAVGQREVPRRLRRHGEDSASSSAGCAPARRPSSSTSESPWGPIARKKATQSRRRRESCRRRAGWARSRRSCARLGATEVTTNGCSGSSSREDSAVTSRSSRKPAAPGPGGGRRPS